MTSVVGTAAIKIEADFAAFNRQVREQITGRHPTQTARVDVDQTSIRQTEGKVKDHVSRVGTLLKGAVAGIGAFGVAQLAKEAIQSTSQLYESAQKLHGITGMSLNSAGQLAAVTKAMDINSRAVGMTFKTLATQFQAAQGGSKSAQASFRALGITQADLQRTGGDMNKIFQLVVQRLHDTAPGAARTAAEFKLLGRGAQALTPILADGGDELRKLTKFAADLGINLGNSKKNLETARDAQFKFNLVIQAGQLLIVNKIVPAISKFVQQIRSGQGAGGAFATAFRAAFGVVSTVVSAAVRAVGGLGNAIKILVAAFVVSRVAQFAGALKAMFLLINVSPVGRFITAVVLLGTALSALAGHEKSVAQRSRDMANAWDRARTAARALRDADLNVIRTKLDLQDAIRAEAIAHKAANTAAATYGRNSQQAKDADLQWRRAKLDVTTATNAHKDAVEDVTTATRDSRGATKEAINVTQDAVNEDRKHISSLKGVIQAIKDNIEEHGRSRGAVENLRKKEAELSRWNQQLAKDTRTYRQRLEETNPAIKDIRRNIESLTGTVGHAASTIAGTVNNVLHQMGASIIHFSIPGFLKSAATGHQGGGKTGKHWGGGWLGGRGLVSADDNIMIGPADAAALGEAVVTRHQAPAIEAGMQIARLATGGAYPYGSLDEVFGSITRPHGHQAGGRVLGHQKGGFGAMLAKANEIEAHHYPYLWGGGHGSFNGPYDCSGAVSAVLHAGGLLGAPVVSGTLAHMYQPGPGTVTIYANPTHTFMRLGGRYFGTSGSNPGGGAGWFEAPSASYLSRFAVRHAPASGVFLTKPKWPRTQGPALDAIGQASTDRMVTGANDRVGKAIASLGAWGGGDVGDGGVAGPVVTASYYTDFGKGTAYDGKMTPSLRGFAELSRGYHDWSALGGLPPHSRIKVGYHGKNITVEKIDVGQGGPGLGGKRRAIDLTYRSAIDLFGSTAGGLWNVTWARAQRGGRLGRLRRFATGGAGIGGVRPAPTSWLTHRLLDKPVLRRRRSTGTGGAGLPTKAQLEALARREAAAKLLGGKGPFPFDDSDMGAIADALSAITNLDDLANITGGKDDVTNMSHLIDANTTLWQSGLYPAPNFSSWNDPASFVITPDSGTPSLSPNIDSVVKQLTQVVGWEDRWVADLKAARDFSLKVIPAIKTAITRRVKVIAQIRERIRKNIAAIRRKLAHITDLRNKIRAERAKKTPNKQQIAKWDTEIKTTNTEIVKLEDENVLLAGGKRAIGDKGELATLQAQLGEKGSTGILAGLMGGGSSASGLYQLTDTVNDWVTKLGAPQLGGFGDIGTQMLEDSLYKQGLGVLATGAAAALKAAAAEAAKSAAGDSAGADSAVTDNSAAMLELQKQINEQLAKQLLVSQEQYKVLAGSADLFPPYAGRFAEGGVVPGPPGAPRTIIAHGGEEFLGVGARRDPTPVIIEIHGKGVPLQEFIDMRVRDGVQQGTRAISRRSSYRLPSAGGGGPFR